MILAIKDFQIAYPYLWKAINEVRIESGSNGLDKDYPTQYSIPIKMHDAALADRFLEKQSNDEIKETPNPVILGYNQLQKIIEVVKTEANMARWLDKLYYKDNPKGLYSDRYKAKKKPKTKKEVEEMARKNVITGEVIAYVTKDDNDIFKVFNRENDEEITEQVKNQKKLKYAFDNKGCIRGRTRADGTTLWRAVKERFVREDEVNPNMI